MGKLDGKVAVITGATSGMALASAKLFVKEGAFVFITGRDRDRLNEAVRDIGTNVVGVQADSGRLTDLRRLMGEVEQKKGRIDILFASAGRGSAQSLEQVSEEEFDLTFGINVRGTLFLVQKALPLLVDGASVFLNGSSISVKGVPSFGVYAASKAALRALVRTWALEQKHRGIRFNVLSPGTIDTPLLDPLGEAGKEFFRSQIPRGQLGSVSEVAGAALFLASDDSSFVNATDLFVDGGTCQV